MRSSVSVVSVVSVVSPGSLLGSLLVTALVVCALAAPAAADGVYVTQSMGGADVKDELGERIDSAGRFRLGLGVRRGAWAAELWGGLLLGSGHAARVDACVDCRPGDDYHTHSTMFLGAYGLDLKYLQPLSRHVDVYLRGGVSAMRGHVAGDDYGGRGLGVGAGVQLKGKVRALGLLWWPLFFTGIGPKVTAAIWADTGYDFYRLHPGGRLQAGPTIDAQLTSMSMGFSVGTDF
jgi:Outer membrane protein beta-barrel domain